jgi:hypothetical protein
MGLEDDISDAVVLNTQASLEILPLVHMLTSYLDLPLDSAEASEIATVMGRAWQAGARASRDEVIGRAVDRGAEVGQIGRIRAQTQ